MPVLLPFLSIKTPKLSSKHPWELVSIQTGKVQTSYEELNRFAVVWALSTSTSFLTSLSTSMFSAFLDYPLRLL